MKFAIMTISAVFLIVLNDISNKHLYFSHKFCSSEEQPINC